MIAIILASRGPTVSRTGPILIPAVEMMIILYEPTTVWDFKTLPILQACMKIGSL